jgi:hypothetical protein
MKVSGTNEYVEVNGLEMEVLCKNTRDLLFKTYGYSSFYVKQNFDSERANLRVILLCVVNQSLLMSQFYIFLGM